MPRPDPDRAQPGSAASHPVRSEGRATATKYRILLVDDEPLVLDALSQALVRAKDFHCEIATAVSGEEAVRKAAGFDPHVVLADFRMPGMTGIELLARIQTNHPRAVRALITGYNDLDIAIEALEKARIHYYLQKPWNNEDLRHAISEAVRSANGGVQG